MSVEIKEFDFRNRTPAAPLTRLVASIWYARGQINYKRERIAPTGSTVAIFVLGPPILQTPNDGLGETFRAERGLLVGPHDRPVVNEPTGDTFAVGIVARPVACEALFGVRPSHLRGKVVDLEAVWAEAPHLRAKLLALADADSMLNFLEGQLGRAPIPDTPAFVRCERAVALLENDPTRRIADIAADLGISHAHLDRELGRFVGLSPRALSRLMRLRRLLSQLDVNASVNWSDLAVQFGWFDQPHFIRDFKRHTGIAPSKYLGAQKALYDMDEASSAAGFVPER